MQNLLRNEPCLECRVSGGRQKDRHAEPDLRSPLLFNKEGGGDLKQIPSWRIFSLGSGLDWRDLRIFSFSIGDLLFF
ncbi:hypothetical protein [Rhodovulum sp. MB263]|uniref:hypothetical protein n=1 Tax=Rhodovulum sp. (strain MB263) TaxID=308754 RepID=UPI0012DB2F50|nr:hypothetical protein [Rhodovulum sp. MB263]